MPSSDTFNSVPVNRAARKRLLREARLGTRTAVTGPTIEPFQLVDTVKAYKEAYSDLKTADALVEAIDSAWEARTVQTSEERGTTEVTIHD